MTRRWPYLVLVGSWLLAAGAAAVVVAAALGPRTGYLALACAGSFVLGAVVTALVVFRALHGALEDQGSGTGGAG